METPASCYQPSRREMPKKLPPIEYPDRFEVRCVSANGGIRWRMGWVMVSMACIGENVGWEEIDNGLWNVYFGSFKLGRFNDRTMTIESACRKFNPKKVQPMSPDTSLTYLSGCPLQAYLSLSGSKSRAP